MPGMKIPSNHKWGAKTEQLSSFKTCQCNKQTALKPLAENKEQKSSLQRLLWLSVFLIKHTKYNLEQLICTFKTKIQVPSLYKFLFCVSALLPSDTLTNGLRGAHHRRADTKGEK